MDFPQTRLRRLRTSDAMRRLTAETILSADNFVYPLFVKPGRNVKEPIKSMSDCFYFSPDTIAAQAEEVLSLGIPAMLLFGQDDKKDEKGTVAWAENGVVQTAVRNIKKTAPELMVITDVCLCAYTTSGHCGLVKDGKIDNDSSCEVLAKIALSHAQAGTDIVAPSDMMDGRVGIIRQCLDSNGFCDTAILAYSAKYASAFYGPFRDIADSKPAFGDRRSYQMDILNCQQAIREIELDIKEGADIVMVKPALCFLDIISQARKMFNVPIAAYNVSGEYMMVNAAAKAGILEKDAAMMEMLYSIKRAGAHIIITYFAKQAAKLLK